MKLFKTEQILISTYLLLSLFLMSCSSIHIKKKPHEFRYLEFKNDTLKSTHAIQLSLKIPSGYRKIVPLNHKAIFNNHPFNVSIAALKRNENIIIVHAEKVTDSSGFLDYSYLKPVILSGINFFMKYEVWSEDCIVLSNFD